MRKIKRIRALLTQWGLFKEIFKQFKKLFKNTILSFPNEEVNKPIKLKIKIMLMKVNFLNFFKI